MAGTLAGFVHLPDFESISGDVVQVWLLLFLDGTLQVTDSSQRQNVNRKGIAEFENLAVERDFSGHARGTGVSAIGDNVPDFNEVPGIPGRFRGGTTRHGQYFDQDFA